MTIYLFKHLHSCKCAKPSSAHSALGLQYIPKVRVCQGRYPSYHTDWMVKNVLRIHFLRLWNQKILRLLTEPNFKFWHLRPTQFFVIVLLLNCTIPFIKSVTKDLKISYDIYFLNIVMFENLKVLKELTVLAVTLPCVRLKLLDDNDTV